MSQIGTVFKKAMSEKLTVKQLARSARITEGYTRLLVNGYPVRLSDRVYSAFCKALRLAPTKLKSLQDAHNKRTRKWYREYRKKRAAA